MGFKDPEAKKAYNKAYYQANKLKILSKMYEKQGAPPIYEYNSTTIE